MTDFNASIETNGAVVVADGAVVTGLATHTTATGGVGVTDGTALPGTLAGGGSTAVAEAPAPVDPVVIVVPSNPRLEAIAKAERLAAEATVAEGRAVDARLRYSVAEEKRLQTDIEVIRLSAEKARATEDLTVKIREIDVVRDSGAMTAADHARISDALRAELLSMEAFYTTSIQAAEAQKAVVVRDVELTRAEVAATDASAAAARAAAELAAAEAACFAAGTLIATPDGERPVETLAIGDTVTTADGDVRTVRWIGRQTIVTAFADTMRALPVRIAAGALGEALPRRDLTLSPDHALLIDGVLVQAGALVDGLLVTRVAAPGPRFTYFHIELADHALILAEGVPAETFVDNVTRARFDNVDEFVTLYGETGPTIAELDVPRIKSARQLPRALRARLDARAASLCNVVATAA
jgi:hypothetical protein